MYKDDGSWDGEGGRLEGIVKEEEEEDWLILVRLVVLHRCVSMRTFVKFVQLVPYYFSNVNINKSTEYEINRQGNNNCTMGGGWQRVELGGERLL